MDDAIAAAGADDWGACVCALVVAWRPTRSPALAELIDRVAARAVAPAVAPRDIAARIARATAVDVGEIVATIRRQMRTQPGFAAHAKQLADACGPDPRIAALLASLVEHSPFANGIGALDAGVLDRLAAIDDPRFRGVIRAAAEELGPRRGRLVRRRAAIDHLLEVAARTSASNDDAPAEDPAIATIDVALARPSRERASAGDREALFAAVYANPADTEARLVLADVLQAAGDPRGEVIALQCGRASDAAPSRRERELLKTHARPWLGAIEPLVQKQGVVYRRGFVAAARLAVRGFRELPAQPEWQTIEELDLVDGWGETAARWLPTLHALREVTNFYHGDLPRLREGGPLAWTSLGIRYPDERAVDVVASAPVQFRALAVLDLSHRPIELAWLRRLHAVLARRLRVAVPLRGLQATALAALVGRVREAGLRELELVPEGAFAPISEHPALLLDLATAHATIHARKPKLDPRHPAELLERLLGANVVRTVALAPGCTLDPTKRARLDAVLAARGLTI